MEARYYHKEDKKLVCDLCPNQCILGDGEYGKCRVRRNEAGTLLTLNYGRLSALAADPVEKKPLYHFYPGSFILSAGSWGCNFTCNFCQNHHISQFKGDLTFNSSPETSPAMLVEKALETNNNIGIAFTYNEPVVWFEYMYETALLAKEKNLKTVVVSNGYINIKPLSALITVIDAFNIDLKAFDNNFYKKHTSGSLYPVLSALETISGSGKHLEITMLLIPGLNDDRLSFRYMCEWIADNCGRDTVLHLSRYFPGYRSKIPPTPKMLIENFCNIAAEILDYVYPGNITVSEGSSDTSCPSCRHVLISRSGYRTSITGMDDKGACTVCGKKVMDYLYI